jgi:predicted dehydrogenase
VVSVKSYLCAKIPDNVSSADATFTPLAAIALNAIRMMDVKPGSRIVVSGLGLIGQLAVRILRAQGAEVMGIDLNPDKCALAEKSGAHCLRAENDFNPVPTILSWTGGKGVDGVLITASSPSHEIISQAAQACCYRGKIVLIGVIGLNLKRGDFYRNEVSFQVSNSYGLRQANHPFSTQENFKRVLELMSQGKLIVHDLISIQKSIEEAPEVYSQLTNPQLFGLSLVYRPRPENLVRQIQLKPTSNDAGLKVGILGTGNFTQRTLLPELMALDQPPSLEVLVSAQGASTLFSAKKFNAASVATDPKAIFKNRNIKAVFISTRHHLHATQTITALSAGQSVWVEKPLALTENEIDLIEEAARKSPALLMVGFNRRFAPLALHARKIIASQAGPKTITINVNAGSLPPDHWTLNPAEGGGRIVGEACHFIDLLRFLISASITQVSLIERFTDGQDGGKYKLEFTDGSTGYINYLTNLPKTVPKEMIQVTGKRWNFEINNWQQCRGQGVWGINKGWGLFQKMDKGHSNALASFIHAVDSHQPSPIPLSEIIEVSRWAVRMQAMTHS